MPEIPLDLRSILQERIEGRDRRRKDDNHPIWIHVRLPGVDDEGDRTSVADWQPVVEYLSHLRGVDCGREAEARLKYLSRPFSRYPVLTGVGVQVTRGDNGAGRSVSTFRTARISMVTLSSHVLVTARHRDGLVPHNETAIMDSELFRRTALRKRDAFRLTALNSALQQGPPIDENTTAHALGMRIFSAMCAAHARLMTDTNRLVREAESSYSALVSSLGGTEGSRLTQGVQPLLGLIASSGTVQAQLREAREDSSRREPFITAEPTFHESATRALRDAEAALGRERADARAAVDMVGSTLASQQLQLARRETVAAEAERTRRDEEADRREEIAQQLQRDAALLASILLVPSLVAAFFGANVRLPGGGSVQSTWTMVAAMIAASSLAYWLIRRRDRYETPSRKVLSGVLILSLVSGGVGALTALGAFTEGDNKRHAGGTPAFSIDPRGRTIHLDLGPVNCPCEAMVVPLDAAGRSTGSKLAATLPHSRRVRLVIPRGRRSRTVEVQSVRVAIRSSGEEFRYSSRIPRR